MCTQKHHCPLISLCIVVVYDCHYCCYRSVVVTVVITTVIILVIVLKMLSKSFVSMLDDPLLKRTNQCDKYDNLLKEKEHCKLASI